MVCAKEALLHKTTLLLLLTSSIPHVFLIFPPQERPVIIVSMVRAKEALLHYDERHHLGFLSNPKRFNVAITRAQALLIVVGNPHLLCMDFCWKTLVRYEFGITSDQSIPRSVDQSIGYSKKVIN